MPRAPASRRTWASVAAPTPSCGTCGRRGWSRWGPVGGSGLGGWGQSSSVPGGGECVIVDAHAVPFRPPGSAVSFRDGALAARVPPLGWAAVGTALDTVLPACGCHVSPRMRDCIHPTTTHTHSHTPRPPSRRSCCCPSCCAPRRWRGAARRAPLRSSCAASSRSGSRSAPQRRRRSPACGAMAPTGPPPPLPPPVVSPRRRRLQRPTIAWGKTRRGCRRSGRRRPTCWRSWAPWGGTAKWSCRWSAQRRSSGKAATSALPRRAPPRPKAATRQAWSRLGGRAGRGGCPAAPPGAAAAPTHSRPPRALPRRSKLQLAGWRFVVTGHSLGAAVATLLGMHLRQQFPGGCFTECLLG